MPPDTRLDHHVGGASVRLPDLEDYALAGAARLMTPALLVYPDWVDANVAAVLRLLGGDASRWRAHVKSAKLTSVMAQLVAAGVTHLKCATTLELKVAYHRAITNDTGPVEAIGKVLSFGRRVAFSEAQLSDANGRLLASATSTLLVFELPAARG
jgi:uncharacterized protein (TIGR00369 family)